MKPAYFIKCHYPEWILYDSKCNVVGVYGSRELAVQAARRWGLKGPGRVIDMTQ